jgi:hypothetical protein
VADIAVLSAAMPDLLSLSLILWTQNSFHAIRNEPYAMTDEPFMSVCIETRHIKGYN